MDAALTRRVEQQRIEMLYDNTLAVSGSALLMAALIAVIAWPHTRVANIVAWAGAALLVQVSVLALSGAYRRASDRDTSSEASDPTDPDRGQDHEAGLLHRPRPRRRSVGKLHHDAHLDEGPGRGDEDRDLRRHQVPFADRTRGRRFVPR